MNQKLAYLSLLVRDYDEAIAYFTQTLDFDLLEDKDMGAGKRWVRVTPHGSGSGSGLLLAKAVNAEQ